MDEVATTMCGFMKAPMSFVQNHDDSPCSIVQTCDLDSDKKLCSGLHFLSAVFIPPILLFKGAEGLVPSRSLDRECVSFFSPKACMTSSIMTKYVVPHIMRFNPKSSVLVLDSATSHTTESVVRSAHDAGLTTLTIPGKCTPVLQACDVYNFAAYRQTHNKFVSEAASVRGCPAFQNLTASDKRALMSSIVAESAMYVWSRLDVQDVFSKLGYLRPTTESVKLRSLPTFKFQEPTALDFEAFLGRLERWSNERSADAKDADKAIASICGASNTSWAQKTWAPEKRRCNSGRGAGEVTCQRTHGQVLVSEATYNVSSRRSDASGEMQLHRRRRRQ
jgi:hypothetical protein